MYRVTGGLEPIAEASGYNAGYSPEGIPIHHRAKQALIQLGICQMFLSRMIYILIFISLYTRTVEG